MTSTFNYIACRPDMPWDWDKKEDYLVLKNGGTIAHWNEVKQVIAAIADRGLPLFDVLVILLAASGSSQFSNPADRISECFAEYTAPEHKSALDILYVLQDLDPKYKSGEQRLLMLTTILQRSHITLRLNVSKKISENLLSDVENNIYIDKTAEESFKNKSRVLNCLRIMGNHFPDEQSIVSAMAEFDFEQVQKLDFDLIGTDQKSPENNPIDLEEELLQDSRTNKLAQLIPHVLAGMNFPLIAKKSDNRPEGGVSDLSNKGHFDQLVVTEYAYDDDLFISRIVNNEALFFQREKAKNDHDENYCVLIDASLFAWGEPKFVACAMACCVGLKNPDATLTTYMVGNGIHKVSFRVKEGVVLALKIAEASLNPTAGLLEFMSNEEAFSSVMLISTQKSLNQPEMLEFRNVYGNRLDFITTISEDAEVQINRVKGKISASFQLNLKEIWSEKAQNVKPTQKASFYPEDFPPVRVPVRLDEIRQSVVHEDKMYLIENSGCLLEVDWNKEIQYGEKAGVLLGLLDLPYDFMSLMVINPKEEKEILLFCVSNRVVCVRNLDTKEEFTYHFPGWKNARNRGGRFMYDGQSFVYAFELGHYQFDLSYDSNASWQSGKSFENAVNVEPKNGKNHIVTSWNHYKNIKRCAITQDKSIFFGKRILKVEKEGSKNSVVFESIHYFPAEVKASFQRDDKDFVFTFPNGAVIRVNSYGVLKFSFPKSIQLKGYEIVFKSFESKIAAVKVIHNVSNKGLKLSKEFLEEERGDSITFTNNMQDAKRIHGDLSFAGVESQIKTISLEKEFYMVPLVDFPPVFASERFFSGKKEFILENVKNQREIDPVEFYNLYFTPFIEGILNYEA